MNWPLSIFFASFSACFSSTTSSKSFIRPTMSPIPRIRDARPSARNSSSLSMPSPTPRNLIGLPVISLIESAAPPRASPSSFVMMKPVRSKRRLNSDAVRTVSWPAIASHTRNTLSGLVRCLISSSSCIIASSTAKRPAVSKITTSRFFFFASRSASWQS